jgi:hypothetical protein
MEVSSKNGSVRSDFQMGHSHLASALSAEGAESWDFAKVERRLKHIPQKANASWVMKLEAGITSRIEVI